MTEETPQETAHTQELGEKLPINIDPAYRNLYIGVFQGEVAPPSTESIDEIVETYFPQKPLVTLPTERLDLLKRAVKKVINHSFSDKKWEALAGDLIYLPAGEEDDLKERFLISTDLGEFFSAEIVEKYLGSKKNLLTPQEKEALITQPGIYTNEGIFSGYKSTYLLGQGTRHLIGEPDPNISYGFTSSEDFLAFSNDVREHTKTEEIQILDIGGTTGLAASEMEALDPRVAVTDLTVEQEAAYYDLRGGVAFGIAEQLPDSFYEKYDAVVSNYSFVHMSFPHLALLNALLAVKNEGRMRIQFDYGGQNSGSKEHLFMMKEEFPQFFDWLRKLADDGFIEFLPDHLVEDDMEGMVSLRKHSSIPQERIDELLKTLNSNTRYKGLVAAEEEAERKWAAAFGEG